MNTALRASLFPRPVVFCLAALLFVILHSSFGILHAQVPQIISYQGRVAVGTVNFDGTGQFKFALVNAAGTTTYWSNDGTGTEGSGCEIYLSCGPSGRDGIRASGRRRAGFYLRRLRHRGDAAGVV